jgi:hypothetical protein
MRKDRREVAVMLFLLLLFPSARAVCSGCERVRQMTFVPKARSAGTMTRGSYQLAVMNMMLMKRREGACSYRRSERIKSR